jgi:hypothetical protein
MSADLRIISRDENGVIRVALPRRNDKVVSEKIQGIDKLVQIVALELLRNGQRNIADPTDGTRLRDMIGKNFDPSDEAEAFADVRLRISTGDTNIKERQLGTTRTANERLAQLNLVDIVPNVSAAELEVTLEIISEAEERARAIMGLR